MCADQTLHRTAASYARPQHFIRHRSPVAGPVVAGAAPRTGSRGDRRARAKNLVSGHGTGLVTL